MSKDSDDKSNIQSDAHDTLVKSLESIKDLLLQSESKITAAKASIARASMGPTKAQEQELERSGGNIKSPDNPSLDLDFSEPIPEPIPEPSDDEVPLLDDIVIHGSKTQPVKETQKPPVEESPIIPAEVETGLAPETVNYLLSELQNNLEMKLHDAFIQGIVQLEADIKELLDEEISKLRDELDLK